jgi:hypothetical protein
MGGYTPGPWVVYTADGSLGTVETADGAVVVAQAQQVSAKDQLAGSPERFANARLIASAPTLLEAAQRVTAAFRSLGQSRSLIADFELHKECEAAMLALDAAISRATGEGE